MRFFTSYLSTRYLWDVTEANGTDALIEDFLDNAMGPAKELMRGFYTLGIAPT
ncbi:MAG: hypothetical protein ACYC6A_00280 [Armatimonadota bacterium]